MFDPAEMIPAHDEQDFYTGYLPEQVEDDAPYDDEDDHDPIEDQYLDSSWEDAHELAFESFGGDF